MTDSFLKFGYCVVSYEEDSESLVGRAAKRLRDAQARPTARSAPVNLVPIVPPTNTYDVAYVMTGRAGYKRQYMVYAQAPNHATKIDWEARVVVKQHPDGAGNVNSPMVRSSAWLVRFRSDRDLHSAGHHLRPRLLRQRTNRTCHDC